MMRHHQWNEIMGFLDEIVSNIGSTIFDTRCDKSWDAGQAICAEAYGPNWMHNDTFITWNNKDDDQPPEPHYYDCARKMADGFIPSWVGK